jgi:hypothetical protein
VVLVVLPALVAGWAMLRSYRRRRAAEEAALGPLPRGPEPGRPPDGEALYTGTTYGGSRALRVTAYGLFGRGPCSYWFEPGRHLPPGPPTPAAVVFRRFRGPVVRLEAVRTVALVGAHAGRVLAPRRIAILGWTLGQTEVDTGFAFEDAAQAERFAELAADTLNIPPERGPFASA